MNKLLSCVQVTRKSENVTKEREPDLDSVAPEYSGRLCSDVLQHFCRRRNPSKANNDLGERGVALAGERRSDGQTVGQNKFLWPFYLPFGASADQRWVSDRPYFFNDLQEIQAFEFGNLIKLLQRR
jgi:hypothetical protein